MSARSLLRAAALGGAALSVGVWASGGPGRRVDGKAFRALNRDGGSKTDRLLTGITELGSIWASAGAAAVLSASGNRRAAARGLAAASVTWLAAQGLKRLFLRPRPYQDDPDGARLLIGPPRASSWPSSHPAVLLTFITVAGRELGIGRRGRAALAALATAVGVSRTYVGVHYPADVAGGLLLGRAVAAAWSRDGR